MEPLGPSFTPNFIHDTARAHCRRTSIRVLRESAYHSSVAVDKWECLGSAKRLHHAVAPFPTIKAQCRSTTQNDLPT
jgi:hypothetical protein